MMAKAGATPELLVRAAAEVLEEGGLAAVTMRAVGGRAGVSAMAMYRHFTGRDALLAHLANRAFEQLAARFEAVRGQPVEEALRAMLDAILDLAMSRPECYALAFTAPRTGARVLPQQASDSPTLSVVVETLEHGIEEGIFVIDDVAETAVSFAALIQGLWLARYAGRISLPAEEFRALCHRCVERSLSGVRR